MGCVCCSLSSFVSILLDALERISLCTVCAMLTCCLLFTIITVMVMGIGIGYHYCFVQNSVDAMAKAAKAAGALRSGGGQERGNVMRSVDKAVRRGFTHRRNRREMNGPLPESNSRNESFIQPQNSTDYDQYIEADYEINNDTSNNVTYVLSTTYQNFTTVNITVAG